MVALEVDNWVVGEAERRLSLWHAIGGERGRAVTNAAELQELGIYRGQAGIFFDAGTTKQSAAPSGVAVAVRHTGQSYADELSVDGLIYHFPSTQRRGSHDEGEIEALRAAHRLALPVFVIIGPKDRRSRDLRLAYVESVSESARIALLTFVESFAVPAAGPLPVLVEDRAKAVLGWVQRRPNQQRFAAAVFARYGLGCAVCDVKVAGLVQAAHLIAKSRGGVDDARNGLPLCANHHLALDAGMWRVDPSTMTIEACRAFTRDELGITRSSLAHLAQQPDPRALGQPQS